MALSHRLVSDPLSAEQLIQLSSEFEGHPDNAAGGSSGRSGGVLDRDR